MVRFAHIADCHLGAFGRNPALREYNLKAFEEAVRICIERKVDFIIIAGDLFHNPHPDMEVVNRAVKAMIDARNHDIRIYAVYGSHDFNIAKASLIDVLESAEVFKKVVQYLDEEGALEHVEDPTGVEIAGLSGRKNRMDASYYLSLDFKKPKGDAIFVFHTPVAEMKPADIHESETVPISALPEGHRYYAGGHIHRRLEATKNGAPVLYTGATFGSSYTDLEKETERGFYIVDEWEPEYVQLDVCSIRREDVDADGLKVGELDELLQELSEQAVDEDIFLLKIHGELKEGAPENIDFSAIRGRLEESGAKTVSINRRQLTGKNLERIKINEESTEKIEEGLLEEYGTPEGVDIRFAEELLGILKAEQVDGERKDDYEGRLWDNTWALINELETPKSKKGSGKPGQVSLVDFGGDPK